MRKIKTIIAVFCLVVLTICVVWFFRSLSHTDINLDNDGDTSMSPTLVTSIQNIGQWEFLTIHDEELVDTIRRGIFSDDELIRIYYGTLRIGIDMKSLRPGDIQSEGDSVSISLPKVTLLDDNFIDEARTMSFYESGSWNDAAREEMYQRAKAKMKERCLTPENIKTAQDNAATQMRQFLRSMGFKRFAITQHQ